MGLLMGVVEPRWYSLSMRGASSDLLYYKPRLTQNVFLGLLNQKDERINFIILLVNYHIHKNLIDGAI